METKMSRAAKAIVAAALVGVVASLTVHAETVPVATLPPADQAAVLTPTYLDCGTYYVFVSACMGKKEDAYIEIGKALWARGREIGHAGGITHEAMKERVYSTRNEWTATTGQNCMRIDALLSKQYKGFCEGIYQGLQSSRK